MGASKMCFQNQDSEGVHLGHLEIGIPQCSTGPDTVVMGGIDNPGVWSAWVHWWQSGGH